VPRDEPEAQAESDAEARAHALPEGEPEPGAEPEPGTESTTAQPEPGGEAGPSPVSEEVKTIPITGQAAQDNDVLFGDAPEEKTKVA
jgi:hypothetical protein